MLEFFLLGKLEIRLGGQLVRDFKSKKAQALLCYLAANRQPQSRSKLANLLWGDKPDKSARMNLSQALSALRRYFGDYLKITRQEITLRMSHDVWVDAVAFENLVKDHTEETRIASLQKAMRLYHGDFLAGVFIRNALDYDEWLMSERMRLRELALRSLSTLAKYHAGQGQSGLVEAIDYTSQMLDIDPLDEETHQRMMWLLAMDGRRSAALQQFIACREMLSREFDVTPSPETMALYEQIQQGVLEEHTSLDVIWKLNGTKDGLTAELGTSPDERIPEYSTPLVGRQEELTELDLLLKNPNTRLVTIVGPGGIGKTRLAAAFAHQAAKEEFFPDGVYPVALSSISTRYQLVFAVAESAGLRLIGTRKPEQALFDFLRDKSCLLIFDNFEQLLPEAGFLKQLLQTAPKSKLLVTSRERLKFREEWVYDLEGLPYPDTDQINQAKDYDAVKLFSQRACQIWADFSLEKEIEGVVKICRLAQGMPLAIEQAASLIRVSRAGEIAMQIENRLDALSTTLRDVPERHRSMRAVFDWSWHWLSEEERAALSRLSVFEGSFSYEAAGQVANASRSTLSSLIDKSLLKRSTGLGEVTRYEMHELIRQYAGERLSESGEASIRRVYERHLEYYLSLAEKSKQFWPTEQAPDWFELVESDRGNIYAALRWANEQQQAEHALQLSSALVTFFIYNRPSAEVSYWLEASLAIPWDKSSRSAMRARAEALVGAGHAALQNADISLAEERFNEACELYSTLKDQRRYAWALRGLGAIGLISGNLDEARPLLEESLGICQKLQTELCSAWSLLLLGNLALAKNELERAEIHLEEALALFYKQSNRGEGAFRTMVALGYLRCKQGKFEDSENLYMEAISKQRKHRYIQFVAQILEGLAYLATADENPELAVKLLGAAQARHDTIEAARWAHHEADYKECLDATKKQLNVSAWQAAWDAGYDLALQQGGDFDPEQVLAVRIQ